MPLGFGIAALVLVVAFGVCEVLGWPFLGAPLQRWLSTTLDRRVSFEPQPGAPPSLRVRFLGGIHAEAGHILIAAPPWSQAPHMVEVRDADLRLRYIDVWRAYRGEALRIRQLKAAALDGTIERLADGRASWKFGDKPPDPNKPPTPPPTVELLQVESGTVAYRDAVLEIVLDSRFSLVDGSAPVGAPAAPRAGSAAVAASASGPSPATGAGSFVFNATGTYRKNVQVRVDVRTSGVLQLVDGGKPTMPIVLHARAGGAEASFEGTATDPVSLGQLRGRFSVSGSSLAAAGDPLGVTLPTTAPFRTSGLILKEGNVWNAVFERATVGDSSLTGAFTFDAGRSKPLLSGRLEGSRLLLADLGPAVGAPVRTGDAAAAAPGARQPARSSGKVIPDRPFDLPSLRAMDANVLVDVAYLDVGTSILQPLRPLRAHIVLQDGVLTLRDIDARTADGQLAGLLSLDGRGTQALWNADMRWDGVRLETWIKQARSDGAPPYLTGRLNGQATLAGQGRSTAAILGSLKGGVRMYVLNGTISHLAIEAAGLDAAQAIGVYFEGDESLKIQCTVADLVADKGLLKPRALVLDTGDTTLVVDGSLSLATEALDLRVAAMPKDFSPLAPRSPLLITGSFADPAVGIEKTPLITRAGAAALLGVLVTPLAALLPLIDFGASDEAKQADANCRALAQRVPAKAAPRSATRTTPTR